MRPAFPRIDTAPPYLRYRRLNSRYGTHRCVPTGSRLRMLDHE